MFQLSAEKLLEALNLHNVQNLNSKLTSLLVEIKKFKPSNGKIVYTVNDQSESWVLTESSPVV